VEKTQESNTRKELLLAKSIAEIQNSPALLALWYDAHEKWDKAHEVVQDGDDKVSARIHAYLHRKEGDLGNARYWYGQSGEKVFEGSLEQEFEVLLGRFFK
jgi:hypothetical protein